ncbi:hypothetical protein N0V83_008576 [Neocucurbitaria cava]|uniref:NAD-dependent epimerase/dehydratase domain-containing protein n=1 Tax=Neocucurbitaria cava TaxID=798079 RepID=A0A9W8Y387_9PLEO|nr:hypothetical protein N0V83_008576 [Neocucurbitaria cava]
MGQNVLITGAAGYIGGSVLAEFVSRTSGSIPTAKINAAVRSEDQVQSLSGLGVNVIQLDLSEEADVLETILRNDIDIVLLASDAKALTGSQSSVTTLFSEEGGWIYGEVRDTDSIFEKEKELGESHPVRQTNIVVVEEASRQGVASYNLAIPTVSDGRGSGECRKLSVSIPQYVRTSIKHKTVYRFDKDGVSSSATLVGGKSQCTNTNQSPPAAHISDLTALYALLVEKIIQQEPFPSGKNGYYFAMAHRAPWWDVMDGIAKSLHARGLVDEDRVQVWQSDKMAAEYLGFPELYVRAMGTSTGELVPVNANRLGWEPKWDKERFLESIDDEVQAVLELDTVKATVFDALKTPSA